MRTLLVVFSLLFAANSFAGAGNSPGGSLDSVGVTQAGQTTVSVTSTAAQALPANANRKYLFIQNSGATNPVTCKFGGTFISTEGFTLTAGQMYQMLPPIASSIWCKSTSGTTVNFIEGIQ
jgi:hypothetical protein